MLLLPLAALVAAAVPTEVAAALPLPLLPPRLLLADELLLGREPPPPAAAAPAAAAPLPGLAVVSCRLAFCSSTLLGVSRGNSEKDERRNTICSVCGDGDGGCGCGIWYSVVVFWRCLV